MSSSLTRGVRKPADILPTTLGRSANSMCPLEFVFCLVSLGSPLAASSLAQLSVCYNLATHRCLMQCQHLPNDSAALMPNIQRPLCLD